MAVVAKIRVIAGEAKGRKLSMVSGGGTRPISDRVKEALFNIIGNDIKGSSWLDLFAGTGSVGIEALSRGAERAIFIDTSKKAVETVQENLTLTGLYQRADIQRIDAYKFLAREPQASFDYIYIAPPQYAKLWSKAVLMIDGMSGWLNRDGWVIAQLHPKEYEELSLRELFEFDNRRYGNTLLIFYKTRRGVTA